jgi:hypothetical protein
MSLSPRVDYDLMRSVSGCSHWLTAFTEDGAPARSDEALASESETIRRSFGFGTGTQQIPQPESAEPVQDRGLPQNKSALNALESIRACQNRSSYSATETFRLARS